MSEHRTYGQWSFNAGELSPRMLGRVDQNIYGNGGATMLGWLPLLQGPMTAMPGTMFVSAAAGPCRLFPFESIITQGYVIEASDFTFRFYTNDVRIETAPGIAYEVAHPWTLEQLWQLDYWQSNDVLYLVGAGLPPKKLERIDAVTFQLIDLNLKDGPIELGNSDEGVTVQSDGVLGAVNLVADTIMWLPSDIGSLFELVAKDFNDVPGWEPGMTITTGNEREWGGRVYQALDSGRTGGNPPEHIEGIAWDGSQGTDINGKGPYGVRWQFLYNAYGMVKITGFTDSTHVAAEVTVRLADSIMTSGTWRWSFGSFSDRKGWPDTVGGWNDCLVLTRGNRVFTSVIDDFENFGRRDPSGDFQRDLAGGFTLPKPATIRWQASDRLLLLGTDTDEYTVERIQIQTGTPGPPVFEIKLQSSYGSAFAIKPIQSDGRMLFLQRAGRKLREFGYALQSDRYVAPDMTRLADHLSAPHFSELAWQAEPERLAWARREDGVLACMTYDPEEQVMGWARRQLGGGGNDDDLLLARGICRITEPDGRRDQLWIAAETLTGAFWVLRMAKIWEYGDDPATAVMADAALSYNGPPDQSFAGLDHLEGRLVDILADAKPHRQLTVTRGAVTLDYPASQVSIGLPFPAVWTSLPPEVGQDEGTARGKTKRVIDITLHVVEAQGIQVTAQDSDPVMIETREAEAPQDVATPLFTGLMSIPTIGTYEQLGQVTIKRVQPTPATIIALVPTIEVAEQ